MTTAVATDLESIVRNNLKLLGIPDTPIEPTIDCHCKVSAQRVPGVTPSMAPSLPTQVPATVQMETPLVQFINAPPQPSQQVQTIPSQFVPGLKTFPTDVPLHPNIPGNEPFILPAGVTPEAIIDFQRVSAEEAYEEQLEEDRLKRIAEEERTKAAIIKAEQEAAALAAKTAQVLQTTSETPVAVAVAVSPVTQEASAALPITPSTSAPPVQVSMTTIKEPFATFPTRMNVNEGSFDFSTILLFLFIGFVVYKIKAQQ